MGKRPEIARAVVLSQAGEHEARDGIVEVDFDQQEPFVVAEADVVARLVFLDQFAFQQKRLRFAADGVSVEVVDGLDQRR